jgi:phosphohistidine phosphatase SixA
MRYFKIILIFFLFLLNKTSFANENIVEILKKENNIIFIRHTIAPGNGDPPNFDISDCSTQRNLSKEGELQALKIGKFFRENDIKFTKVLSSEWCRCKDTAKIAFETYETKNFLNSFYDERFSENKDKQISDFQKFIKNWNYSGNLALVTHYVVISEILDLPTSSGEIVITNKNLEILSSLEIN